MRSKGWAIIAVTVLGSAQAQATCYFVFDRNDNMIYREHAAARST